MQTLATTTTTTAISSACPSCGTIKKSGKLSCCARDGSWFGQCGVTANTKYHHSWYEGIQACKARQSITAIVQQQNVVQQNSNDSEVVIKMTSMFVPASAEKPISITHNAANVATRRPPINLPISDPIRPLASGIATESERMFMNKSVTDMTPLHPSASAAISTREWEHLSCIVVCINALLLFVVR